MTVAAKRIRVSDDSGSNWYTMPGNTGQLQNTSAAVDDTVFGTQFKSMQPTSIDGKITCNAFFKGFAGYVATLKKSGSSTLTSGEATTHVSGQIYQVTSATKRYMDRSNTVTVLDGVTDVTAQVLSIDYLTGTVTFKGSYTVVGAVTLDYHYLPMAVIAKSNSFTLTQTADSTDTSDFETLQGNSGHKTYQQGLKTVELSVKGFYDAANSLGDILDSRAEIIIEICPDGSGQSVARGFFRCTDVQLDGNVGAIETSTAKFSLNVPDDDLLPLPFSWTHTASTIPMALVKSLTAWVDGSAIAVQYLPDGTNGFEADECFVTEISLAGGVDAINTFSCTFQISGTQTAVP
jgi:hypothetical protein